VAMFRFCDATLEQSLHRGNDMPIQWDKNGTRKDPKKYRRKTGRGKWEIAGDLDHLPKALREASQGLSGKQLALLTAWMRNGRNQRKACETVGYSEPHASVLFNNHPLFVAAKEMISTLEDEETREWADLLPTAKRTLVSLLEAKDEKVKYLAAKDIVDRAEGKAINRVSHTVTEYQSSLSDGEIQLVISIMHAKGLSFPEAVRVIQQNPDKAQQWIEMHSVKGGEIQAEYVALPPQSRDDVGTSTDLATPSADLAIPSTDDATPGSVIATLCDDDDEMS